MNFCKDILYLFAITFVIFSYSQEIPPIQIFNNQDYNAEDQNWAVSQSQNNFIYIANNSGLLEYNGATWRLYDSPNEGILRSVRVVDDKIYTGSYMDFGYWIRNDSGNLFYTSLLVDKELKVREDEEFWGIIDIEDYVLFQSFERIYIYNTTDNSFTIIDSKTRINKIYKVDETIYFQKNAEGVYRIENGREVLVIPSDTIQNNEIIGIYNYNEALMLQTKASGFYLFIDGKIEKWNLASDNILDNVSIYSSIRLKDGSFVLGTISNGVIILDKNGSLVLMVDKSLGLSNNTVLSVTEDNYGNIWLGLDNGINVVNLNSPYRVYKDKLGILGTVYASAKVGDYLYLGTNQGLFYKSSQMDKGFKFVEGTEGQVWSLDFLKGYLLCGHDNGTFLINGNTAKSISNEKGTWAIKEIEGEPNLLVQGNYKGLNILEKKGNSWVYRNKIEGFDISSRYFEFSNLTEILVSHEHKGVYRLKVDSTYRKVLNYNKIQIEDGIKSSILSYNNSILYNCKKGVYKYDVNAHQFKKDTTLSKWFSGNQYVSGKLIEDKRQNRMWGFSMDEIVYVEPGKLSDEPEVNVVPIPSDIRGSKSGYENVLHLRGNKYLFGTTDGYLIVDLDKLEQKSNAIHLNNILYGKLPNVLQSLNPNKLNVLKSNDNNIKFNYSTTNYNKLMSSKYQYRLEGIYNDWSKWSSNSEVLFENLPFGDYKFEARAITGGIVSSNILSYSFSIEKPWYLKPIAIIGYVLLLLLLGLLLQYLNIRYYRKQKLKLIEIKEKELKLKQSENQRQLMQVKNENLQLDIENKSRELGIATMNLVKRNELLNDIKEELSRSKSLEDFKKVIKLINSSLNNTSDWKLFEEAFNNVDKDFMKKVKTLHPSITPNDLRLCAYLRLNLSSKEIAPLLNISHKSVEVKRYRLRKKMGLDHDQSLSNYIIEL